MPRARWANHVRYTKQITLADGAETVKASSTNGAFTNQPDGDAIELVSGEAADDMTVTLYGTTQGGDDTVSKEEIDLDGTNVVTTTKTDWGKLLGAELSGLGAGTITIREASGNATITTIDSTAATQSGVDAVAVASQTLNYPARPVVVAAQASTKQVGLVGVDQNESEVLDSQALSGATRVVMNSVFKRVTKVLVGDLASGDDVTVEDESEQNVNTAHALHNAGTAGTVRVSYRTIGTSGEHIEDTVYLGQGETRDGNFWRVWRAGAASGVEVHAQF